LAKELKTPGDNQGWEDLIRGSKSSANISTSTESKDKTNIESGKNTKAESSEETIIESNGETKISASMESTVETIISANIKSKTISIEKRLKYLDKKEHRSYYIDKEIIKKIDKVNKKYNIDKSDIVNEALKLLFETLKI
jgi:hypothetical protein